MKKNGFSLVELLIVVLISFFLISLTIRLLLSLNSFFINNQLKLHAQSSARYIVWSLRNSIESAGYAGCSKMKNMAISDYYKPIEIFKNSINGDTLRVNSATISSNEVYKKINNYQIVVSDHFFIHENDNLLISDCINSEIIHIKKIGIINKNYQLISSFNEIKNNYDHFSKVYLFNTIDFYVLDGHFYKILNHKKEELLSNIHSVYFKEIKNFVQIKLVFEKKRIIFFVPERELIE